MAEHRLKYFPAICGLIIAGFVIYSNTLQSPFYLDDYHQIVDNPHIRLDRISPDEMKDVFNSPARERPFVSLTNLTFAVNYLISGYSLPGFHLVNIILHLVNAVLLLFLVKATLELITDDKRRIYLISFLTSLIWIAHPVNTQSVTYIVQRMTSLSALFYLLSLLMYIEFRGGRMLSRQSPAGRRSTLKNGLWLAGCIFAGILSVWSKETGATLPVFIFLYEWFFFQDLSRKWFYRNLVWIIGLVVFIGGTALLFLGKNPIDKIMSLYVSTMSIQHFTMGERLLTEIRILIYYFSLFFFPHPSRLHLDYVYPLSHSATDPAMLICFAAIAALLVVATYSARRYRVLAFAVLWFFGNLMIESSFIGLAPIFEHRTYVPFMMVSTAAVYLVFQFIRSKRIAVALLTILICTFSIWTYQRNELWQDRDAFWRDNIAKSPSNPRPQAIYGTILMEEGQTSRAIEYFKKALALKPDYRNAYALLGQAYQKTGESTDAAEYLRNALMITPDDEEVLNELGNLMLREHRIDDALNYYDKAVKIAPDYAISYNNLANACFQKNDITLARQYYLKAIQLDPDYADAHYNLALILTRAGDIDEAIIHYQQAIRLMPANPAAYEALGDIYFIRNQIDAAIENYNEALRIEPLNEKIHFNLAVALMRRSRYADASVHLKRVLSIDPGHNRAKMLLMQLKSNGIE